MLVAVGGGVGAVMRFFMNIFFAKTLPAFPISVLLVNILGSFFAGVFFALILQISVELKLLLLVGFLGAFTTFSAFSLDNLMFLQSGRYIVFMANISLNFALSLGAVTLGYIIFK